MSPFSSRGKHERPKCPTTGGGHSYGPAFTQRGVRISWCTKCDYFRFSYGGPYDREKVNKVLKEFHVWRKKWKDNW